ncbi:DUF885 domain-containing protein [Nocardia australiensis]|uniref:DUF885 domain-containing protein n=1 Tax=Nocardia australiensis TaxID=2887191 RepID=UPI001D15311D|nr:DUF885 domain-containing protein [Nocardia australiensis]
MGSDDGGNGQDSATYSQDVLEFLWSLNPDAAIEIGRLPPVLWEESSRIARDGQREQATRLLERAEGTVSGDVAAAARFHVDSAASLLANRDIGELNHMTGPVARLSWAAHSWPQVEDPRFEVYVERLRAFPSYAAGLIREIEDAEASVRGSQPVLRAFLEQVDTLFAEQKAGSAPLLSLPNLPAAVLDDVYQALSSLRAVAVSALGDAATASPLAGSSVGGDRYRDAIFRGTSLFITPQRLETIGLELLGATERDFACLADSAAARDTLISGADILRRFTQTHEILVANSPRLCERWPKTPCEVVAMPGANASTGPPAFYGPSSYRNGRSGSLYVNMTVPSSTRSWEVLPLAMHEGVPGHHLQIALLDENDAVPDILRLLPVNAFTEGWAVYAETLTAEIGLAVTDSDTLGLLAHQRWRAARLVADVGLHVRGWSVEQAVTFIAAQTLQDSGQVRKEVVRYLAWPGQALGYAIGAQVISNWVRERVGAGNTLAAAHTKLLDRGSLPLRALTGADHFE